MLHLVSRVNYRHYYASQGWFIPRLSQAVGSHSLSNEPGSY